MADRTIKVDYAFVRGSCRADGQEIHLNVETQRELRNGKTETLTFHIDLDTYQIACVRRTLRKLGDEAIALQRKHTDEQEANLETS